RRRLAAPAMSELSAEQQARLERCRERWQAVVHSTTPADRGRAEHALRELYRQSGRPQPEQIVWCDSPREPPQRQHEVGGGHDIWRSMGVSVGEHAWRTVLSELEAAIPARVFQALEGSQWRRYSRSVYRDPTVPEESARQPGTEVARSDGPAGRIAVAH